MKKLLLVLVASVLFVSCSDDDDPIQITSDFLGAWNAVSVDYTRTTVYTEASGISTTSDYVGEGYDVDFVMTVSEDPNVITANGSYNIERTISVQGQYFTDFEEDLEFINDASWSISGDTLTMTNQGESDASWDRSGDTLMVTQGESTDFTITELTETSLIIEATEEGSFSESGASFTTTITMTLVFTR